MHANATLTPLTRAQMVAALTTLGLSVRVTATTFGVCEKTVRRWLARARQEGFPQRLQDRSSVPRRQPRKTSAQLEAQILALRRATGDRSHRHPGAGVESLHVAIDDHSRGAFASLFPDEKTPSVLAALQQAIDFYKAHGIHIQRILTDRGSTYRSKLFAHACQQLGIKHRFTRPYRPQTNGKAERFIQTITREWACARSYDSSDHRATFLPLYLHDYNFHRPHSALNSLPPSSRLPKIADNVSRYNS